MLRRPSSRKAKEIEELITVGGLTFLYHQQTNKDAGETWVRFGIPKQNGVVKHCVALSCVTFVVFDDAAAPITLDWVGYHPRCAEPELPESSGSADMLRLAVHTIFERFPERTSISFSDTSKLNRCYEAAVPRAGACTYSPSPSAPPVAIPLSYHSVLLHGRTWYQRHFGARPISRRGADPETELSRVRAFLEQPLPQGGFQNFWDTHVAFTDSPRIRWWTAAGGVRDAMEAAWVDAASWHAFFRAVNDALGCGVFQPIIDSLLMGPIPEGLQLNMNMWEWQITRRNNTMTGGGSRRLVTSACTATPEVVRAGKVLFAAADRMRRWEQSAQIR